MIYLAGPMSGRPQFNYPLFDEVADQLRSQGWTVVSPAEMDHFHIREASMSSKDGDLTKLTKELGETWGDFLSRDVKLIADSEINSICLLPEWETSRGARLEVFVCMGLNYPVYFWTGGEARQLSYERVLHDIKESILI